MILADKITDLRKKNGWSQEDLAEKLGVSRQSVSKWESAQSIPDMNKILKMPELFGVTTDYLLKDSIENAVETVSDAPDISEEIQRKPLTPVSMEEADAFLSQNEKNARFIKFPPENPRALGPWDEWRLGYIFYQNNCISVKHMM